MPETATALSQVVVAEGVHIETGEAWQAVAVYIERDAQFELHLATYESGELQQTLSLSPRPIHLSLEQHMHIELSYRFGNVNWGGDTRSVPISDLTQSPAHARHKASPETRAQATPLQAQEVSPKQKDRAKQTRANQTRANPGNEQTPIPPDDQASAQGTPMSQEARANRWPQEGAANSADSSHQMPQSSADRASRDPDEGIDVRTPKRSVIPYGSEIADRVKNHTDQVDRGVSLLGEDLEAWVAENPGLAAVAAATAAKTALQVGTGAMHLLAETVVDPLRLGEGVMEGGWRGWGEDALRAASMLPAPRAVAAAGRAAAQGAQAIGASVLRLSMKSSKSANKSRRVRVRSRSTAPPGDDLYDGLAMPWGSVRGIAGMHRHHLVLKRVFRRCTDPRVRKLEAQIPTVPLEAGEHLTLLHPDLNAVLKNKKLWKSSYTAEEVVETLEATRDYYRSQGIDPFADAVDTFLRHHFEIF